MSGVKGYKVFNPDWTCVGFQYEVGKSYEEDKQIIACKRGFHFCKKAIDCFNYYAFNPDNKVAEIIALGDIVERDDKCATNKIEIVREIPWDEVLELVNTGMANTGNENAGNWNTGNWNTGDWNAGDWNIGSCSSGCFNTEIHKQKFFDIETDMTFEEWRESEACRLMNRIESNATIWISSNNMTEEEKILHREHEITGGYLKVYDNPERFNEWWKALTVSEKEVIKQIPNFNADKFFKITGILVDM